MKSKILWSLAFIIQIYKLFKLRGSNGYYRQLLSKMSNIEILNVKQLKQKLIDGFISIGDLVLTKGVLSSYPANQNQSFLNPKQPVLYSELIVQKVFEIGQSRNTVRKALGKLFTGLFKLSSAGDEIKVFETMKTQFLPTKYYQKTVRHNQKIFNIGWLLSLLLKAPTRVVSNVYTQSVIPQNSQVTILSKMSQSPQISQPLIIGANVESIELFYRGQIEHNTFLQYCIIGCLVITSFFFYKLCLKPLYQQIISKQKESIMNKIQKIFVQELTCSVCHNNLSNVITNPCGHLAICAECWDKKGQAKECVECLAKNRESVVVYPC